MSNESAHDEAASGAEERLRQHLRARLPADEADALVDEAVGADRSETSQGCEEAEPAPDTKSDVEGGGHEH